MKNLDSGLEVYSAGTRPEPEVHPLAVRLLGEIDIDISKHRPKTVDQFINRDFDYVITVCDHANETCPMFMGRVKNRLHLGFEDPAKVTGSEETILVRFREIRDEIITTFKEFYSTIQNS